MIPGTENTTYTMANFLFLFFIERRGTFYISYFYPVLAA